MTLNLDRHAAQHAQAMVQSGSGDVKTLERLITKSLGVLQEQGVYAFVLFLFSRTDKEKPASGHIRKELVRSLKKLKEAGLMAEELDENQSDNAANMLKFYTDHVLDNLDLTLLVRDLYEQTLIYARYGAKAAGD